MGGAGVKVTRNRIALMFRKALDGFIYATSFYADCFLRGVVLVLMIFIVALVVNQITYFMYWNKPSGQPEAFGNVVRAMDWWASSWLGKIILLLITVSAPFVAYRRAWLAYVTGKNDSIANFLAAQEIADSDQLSRSKRTSGAGSGHKPLSTKVAEITSGFKMDMPKAIVISAVILGAAILIAELVLVVWTGWQRS
jgi:hypothetical protein